MNATLPSDSASAQSSASSSAASSSVASASSVAPLVNSRGRSWGGRVITGVISAFLFLDALGKLLMLAPVVEGSQKVGLAVSAIQPLGVVLTLATLLHLVPRTQLIGAILVTAYLGGAVATHVLIGSGAGSLVMPVVMGVLLWVGYALRNPGFRRFLVSSVSR